MSVKTHILLMRNRLSNPEKWNKTGGYVQGKSCIVMSSAIGSDYHRQALDRIRFVIGGDIINWNDDPETSHEMMMTALWGAAHLPFLWRLLALLKRGRAQ